MVKGIDALVILATESAPLTPIASKAHDKGVFIVNVDRGFLPRPAPSPTSSSRATTKPSAARAPTTSSRR